MNKLMMIKECTQDMLGITQNIDNMREIIDGDYPSKLKYGAVILEETLLDILDSYIKHISKLKELMVTTQ